MVPIGSAMAAAIVIGATSRQLHCGKARTANGVALTKSISSNVVAAMRGSYTADISGI